MDIRLSAKTIDTLRGFAAPAVSAGVLNEAEVTTAFNILENSTCESKPERLVTFRSAADQLGISTRTVARMLHCGELIGKRLRPHHPQTMRIFQSSIDKILSHVDLAESEVPDGS